MSGRYGVVLTFDGRKTRGGDCYAGRFKDLQGAIKERDRQAERAWFRVNTPADLLAKGSFLYRWRVWDHFNRRFAD